MYLNKVFLIFFIFDFMFYHLLLLLNVILYKNLKKPNLIIISF